MRKAEAGEYKRIGNLMVAVYSALEGFPSIKEQPDYYKMLADIGTWCQKPKTVLLVAISSDGSISGAIVYFDDMQYYGSGGTATKEVDAAGFRLLAVDPKCRGQNIGKLLTLSCINKARENKHNEVIIHTTQAMQIAWNMYEKLGFKRSVDLDFIQGKLPVYGFRLNLIS